MSDPTTMGTAIANEITTAEAALAGTETDAQIRLAMMIAMSAGILPNVDLTTARVAAFFADLRGVTVETQQQPRDVRVTLPEHGGDTGNFGTYLLTFNNRANYAVYLLNFRKPYGAPMVVNLDRLAGTVAVGFEYETNTESATVIRLSVNMSTATHQYNRASFTAITINQARTDGTTWEAIDRADPWTFPGYSPIVLGVQDQDVKIAADGKLMIGTNEAIHAGNLPANTWDDLVGKPTEFPPSAHTHLWAHITDPPSSFDPGPHTHPVSDISDATTVGQNLVKLTNPGAVSFLRVDAANTITSRSAADFKTDLALNLVENTALSTWAGSSSITTVGTLASGAVPWSLVTGAPATSDPSPHTHVKADITDFAHAHGNITDAGAIGTTSNLVVTTGTSGVLTTSSRSGIDSRSTFPPEAHTHVRADITDFAHTHTTSDITNLSSYTGFDARYYTETESNNRYLQLTGGTLTGPLTLGPAEGTNSIALWFNHGYRLNVDNDGAGTANNRVWLDGPDGGELVLGPRTGENWFDNMRLRSRAISVEGVMTVLDGSTVPFTVRRGSTTNRAELLPGNGTNETYLRNSLSDGTVDGSIIIDGANDALLWRPGDTSGTEYEVLTEASNGASPRHMVYDFPDGTGRYVKIAQWQHTSAYSHFLAEFEHTNRYGTFTYNIETFVGSPVTSGFGATVAQGNTHNDERAAPGRIRILYNVMADRVHVDLWVYAQGWTGDNYAALVRSRFHGGVGSFAWATNTVTTSAPSGASGTVTNDGTFAIYGDLHVEDQIFSLGDADTYMQFHAENQWRVVVGGSEKIEANTTDGILMTSAYIGSLLVPTSLRIPVK